MAAELRIKCPACAKNMLFAANELEEKKMLTCKYCGWDFILKPSLISAAENALDLDLTTKNKTQKQDLDFAPPIKNSAKINEQSLNRLINPTKTKENPPLNSSDHKKTVQAEDKKEEDLFADLNLPLTPNLAAEKSNFPLRWLICCILAALILVAQYLQHNLADLANEQKWRKPLTFWCKTLRCELPPQVDFSQLKLENVNVISHPKFNDSLKINLVLFNEAQFEQLFPKLKVSFFAANNDLIAERIFNANEYLAGEAAGMQLIPAQTKVKISLEILEPEQTAINYDLSLLP